MMFGMGLLGTLGEYLVDLTLSLEIDELPRR